MLDEVVGVGVAAAACIARRHVVMCRWCLRVCSCAAIWSKWSNIGTLHARGLKFAVVHSSNLARPAGHTGSTNIPPTTSCKSCDQGLKVHTTQTTELIAAHSSHDTMQQGSDERHLTGSLVQPGLSSDRAWGACTAPACRLQPRCPSQRLQRRGKACWMAGASGSTKRGRSSSANACCCARRRWPKCAVKHRRLPATTR